MEISQFQNRVFNKIHHSNLVYNTCWEDPRCDRQLLDIQQDSKILMITSAGCNALDYLLDSPARVDCVDMNPRQNALLELKLSLFEQASFSELFDMFGQGILRHARSLYQDLLRENLSASSQKYWDKNIYFFQPGGVRSTFYHHGTSGTFAWLLGRYLRKKKSVFDMMQKLIHADNLDTQKDVYFQIEKKLTKKWLEWLMNQHLVMAMLGVPKSQQNLFIHENERGAFGFILDCLRKVFTQLPVGDNYFWRLYIEGRYTKQCCPEYLKESNFELLRQRQHTVRTHTTTVSGFLQSPAAADKYSHFVLLDHQDWLAANNRAALDEEWRLILEKSQPGAKILLRSAAKEVSFFPTFVQQAVTFESQKTVITHQNDRVGTYGSVYLATVN